MRAGIGARLAASALAVLLPVLLVAGSMVGMEGIRGFEDRREERNAGRVINGRVLQNDVAFAIENVLARHDPEVVILGNSLSNTDVASPLLARRLGLRKSRVQKLSVPNSIGAHWYAILKNRVYANGHRPKLVIVHSDMQSLVAVTPRSESIYLNLLVQMTDDEPVIDAKLGARNWYFQRVRENRGRVRNLALTTARNRMVDLLVHGSLSPTDRKATERALSRVFDAERVDLRLHNNVIPAFQQSERTLVAFDPSTLPDPEDSFLPDITRLVADHDGVVVFVRPPMAPRLPENQGDVVLPRTEQEIPALAARDGAIYVDMRGLDMDDGHFENEDHMNPEGARRFTEALADTVLEVGAWRMPLQATTLDLLKPTAVVDGVLTNVEPTIEVRGQVPDVPRAQRRVSRGPGRMAQFRTDGLGFLSDLATIEVTRHASRCSPIRVLAEGVPLPRPNTTCNEAYRFRKGRMCHTYERVLFTTADGSNPFRDGRTYELALDPERHCDGARWLYPGDHLRLLVPGRGLSAHDDLDSLVLQIHDLSGRSEGDGAVVMVRLWAGDEWVLDTTTTARADPGLGTELPLDRTIGRADGPAVLDLVNRSDRFLLLTGATLGR